MLKFLAALAAPLVLSGALLAGPALAQTPTDPNRLFADSKLVVRDRFSDEIVGKGRDLVFIPGLASSRATWKTTAERLRGHYRLHLIQIAGFSGEPARANASGDVLIPTAEAIDAYLVEQKLTPATVIGHSLGGTTTLYLAQRHPEHLKRAMMVDALPFFGQLMMGPQATSETIRPLAARMRDGTIAAPDAAYRQQMTPQINGMVSGDADRATIMGWTMASDRGVVARALHDDVILDLRPGMAAVKTPMVLLYPAGANAEATDRMYLPLFAAAPSIKTQHIEGARHFIMLDQPKAFADALDAFLAGG
jgi:pimeloyl-ACP methyl ester carboxylesterase